MSRSTFLLPDEELDTLCTQYSFTGIPRVAKPIEKKIRSYKFGSMFESGGAGAVSTVDDYMKFLEALRVGDVILKSETIDFMHQNRLNETNSQNYWYTNYGYGLGVRTPKAPSTTDFGWGGAAGAFLMVDRKNNITAYHAQHTLNSPNSAQRRALPLIISECLLGKNAEKHTDNAGEDVLQRYQ
jgi:CubicO group peptidase (beta-lactamase class C family)